MAINLLPHKEASFTQRFLSWSLTAGRAIIIGVELIVLIAFASRFKLDRDLIDLHDKIKQEENVTKSLSPIEQKSRNLQTRLNEISKVNLKATQTISLLQDIPSLVPDSVFLDSLTLQEKGLKITAHSFSGDGLSSFVRRLRMSNKITDITLENVSRDETLAGQISFSINAGLKK